MENCASENINNNFLNRIVKEDLNNKVYSRGICTRFPPEPNGYLHIGSAYAINISYNATKKNNGKFNLRFDDTNPSKESKEYVNSIVEDIKWLGYDPDEICFGSNYFDKTYEYAVQLIKDGKAYVCDLSPEKLKEYRGTLVLPGVNSPYRDRSVEENLKLFEDMKNGKYSEGEKVLRAKIDMQSPNINMRDPVIYRISFSQHYKYKDKWCIYPMYDFAHPIQDYIEGVTHSFCSAEFKDHRPLYEWVLESIKAYEPPKQREFGRLNMTGVVTSKRYLRQLVNEKFVDGWDDPRLPTIKGLRRRGYTPESIKRFIDEIGVSKSESTVDFTMLEHFIRDDLKTKVPVVMAVIKPLKVVITNYPEGQSEILEIENNVENEEMGKRYVPFSRVIYVDQDDFMEEPVKGFRRLYVGNEVRLKGAYFIKCNEIIKDEMTGEIIEIRCTYDAETKSGNPNNTRKVKGTIHWIDASNCIKIDVNMYEKLILDESLLKDKELTWNEKLNPDSKKVYKDCLVEKSVINDFESFDKFQFIRCGYFVIDRKASSSNKLVFNRIVGLKSSWKSKK